MPVIPFRPPKAPFTVQPPQQPSRRALIVKWLRKTHGWFYYRYRGGESPADCFDRTSNFLESMMRQIERHQAERALVVTHGLTIRCFVMRFLHLRVEDFDRLENPDNCEVITLGERAQLGECAFDSGWWGVSGLRLRPPEP